MLLGRVVDGLDEMAADGDGDQPVGEVEFLPAVSRGSTFEISLIAGVIVRWFAGPSRNPKTVSGAALTAMSSATETIAVIRPTVVYRFGRGRYLFY